MLMHHLKSGDGAFPALTPKKVSEMIYRYGYIYRSPLFPIAWLPDMSQ